MLFVEMKERTRGDKEEDGHQLRYTFGATLL